MGPNQGQGYGGPGDSQWSGGQYGSSQQQGPGGYGGYGQQQQQGYGSAQGQFGQIYITMFTSDSFSFWNFILGLYNFSQVV